jgi:hypothetical protein
MIVFPTPLQMGFLEPFHPYTGGGLNTFLPIFHPSKVGHSDRHPGFFYSTTAGHLRKFSSIFSPPVVGGADTSSPILLLTLMHRKIAPGGDVLSEARP